MDVLYGVDGRWLNVTANVMAMLGKKETVDLPFKDNDRAFYFTDPVPKVKKVVKCINGDEETIIPSDSSVVIHKSELRPLTEKEKDIEAEIKLKILHVNLKIKTGNVKDEYMEQFMATRYINPKAVVLELGGNIGRNSFAISSILEDDANLLVIESDKNTAASLIANRDSNKFKFKVEDKAISVKPLIQKGWDTKVSDVLEPGYFKVDVISYADLRKKYDMKFDTIVCDCEGAFPQIVKDEPYILDGIKLLIIENDGGDKKWLDAELIRRGFKVVFQRPLICNIKKVSPNIRPNVHHFYQVWSI